MKKLVALVVDDSQTARELLIDWLLKSDYEVLEAENGLEAFKKVESFTRPIDLILTDYNMPEMTGIEFLYRLQLKGLALETAKVLISTEKPNADAIRTAEIKNFKCWIVKPVKEKILVAILKKLEKDREKES